MDEKEYLLVSFIIVKVEIYIHYGNEQWLSKVNKEIGTEKGRQWNCSSLSRNE